jgi:hypothetical protein
VITWFDVVMPPALAAEPWYVSGTFWTIVGIVVSILLGIGGIIAAFSSANPRRRLYVYQSSATPLLAIYDRRLEVRYQGEVLGGATVVTVHLSHRGRRDIAASNFAERPVELHIGVPIVTEVEHSVAPGKSAVPPPPWKYDFAEGKILVGPGLIARTLDLSWTVLVKRHPDPVRAVSPIADVEVREGARPGDTRSRWSFAASSIAAGLVGLATLVPQFLGENTLAYPLLIAATILLVGGSLIVESLRKRRWWKTVKAIRAAIRSPDSRR